MKNNLYALFIIVIANYLAQIPYDYHLYGLRGISGRGSLLLGGSLLLFIVPFILLLQKKLAGYYLMLFFLIIEFLFYLLNIISSAMHGHPPFFQLQNHDPILFTAFFIGYVNFIAAGYFLYYFLRNRHIFN